MPTSNTTFNEQTTGDTVVAAFPDEVKGKIVLITGANPGGIGSSTAVSLAKASPKLLIIAGRDSTRLATTAKAIQEANPAVSVESVILDLSSQESCKKAGQAILENQNIPHIDILINNAGVMNLPERKVSPDGIEMQFATNHIGHFLFTNLIAPKLITASEKASAGSTRIINLSSRAVMYGPVRFSDYNFEKKESELPKSEWMSSHVRELWDEHEDKPYVPQAAYGQSKSANVLFSLELNNLLYKKYGIQSIAVHPGAIDTDLGRYMDKSKLEAAFAQFRKMSPGFKRKNLDEGCSATLTAALDPELTVDDLFVADCQVADWAPKYSTDPDKAKQLWHLSEELVGQKFTY